jgi:hypothetical protein
MKPSGMGDTCPLQLFSCNSTFIMFNISKLFDYTCMFSIGANL